MKTRMFVRLVVVLALVATLAIACRAAPSPQPPPTQPLPPPPSPAPTQPAPASPTSRPTSPPATAAPAATPTPAGPSSRVITANDLVPEKVNGVDTVVVLVSFAGQRDPSFDLRQYWDRIFGTADPIRQLNAYFKENFYGQLQLQPVPVGSKGYMEVELPGTPKDYSFGWLVGMSTQEIAQFERTKAQRLALEVMAKVVQQYPQVDYQNKFLFTVLNASEEDYGRATIGAIPGAGADPIYDLFIGDLAPADQRKFTDPTYFRVVGSKVLGVIKQSGYTFDNYFRDRGQSAFQDQFIRGMALLGKDTHLSTGAHTIMLGLRRKSAYATPPEKRSSAAISLFNLLLDSRWIVGSKEHGHFDRSVITSPYIGWWDLMGDDVRSADRPFFSSHPQGTSAFTKLRLGLLPERSIAIALQDDFTVRLAPLSNPTLPARGAEAEKMVVVVPVAPALPALADYYLLLEYRRRVGGGPHPDNFTITPDFTLGDKTWDPGYNRANPTQSRYINPPMTLVSKEGILVYLVNEKAPELAAEYKPEDWYKFVVVLLNPAGNTKRDDLTQAALAAGERMEIDLRSLYPQVGIPVKITVMVTEMSETSARVRIVREPVR